MKKISAIIFPDTVPADKTLIPLLHIFKPVVYCQPIENIDNDPNTNIMTTCENSSFLLYAPAPLGRDRDRFLTLINNIQSRQDDYISQLSYLSLAGIGGKDRNNSESKSSLISKLLQIQGIENQKDEQNMLLLWQARLVLKLGEIFDAQLEKISNDLKKIEARQNELFSKLKEEASDIFDHTKMLSQTTENTDAMQGLRLKAWSRIFSMDKSDWDNSVVYITWNKDALEQLIEHYEKTDENRQVKKVFSCILPAYKSGSSEISLPNREFENDAESVINTLHTAVMSVDTFRQEDLNSQDEKWTSLLDNYFPVPLFGRCRLSLYRFHDTCAKQLFLDCFGRDSDHPQASLPQPDKKDVIIGLLED